MRRLILLLILIMSLPISAFGQPPVNSKCDYEIIPVKVEITSIKELSTSSPTKHEVRFVVLLTPQLPTKVENRVYDRDYQMLLKNKTFPGPLFLEKYGISSGKVYDCNLHLITRGTCRPSYFDFPDIKLDDYFESQPQG